MNLKTQFQVFSIAFSLALSGAVSAKKPEGKGNSHYRASKAYKGNSNKQSDEYSLRGRERAEERHHSKKYKKNKDKQRKYDQDERRSYRDRNDESYHDNGAKRSKDHNQYDRYERQRNQERYQNDPIGIIVDQNVAGVRSKVDSVHRRVIETIDNKARELTDVTDTRRKQDRETSSWWSIFGGE